MTGRLEQSSAASPPQAQPCALHPVRCLAFFFRATGPVDPPACPALGASTDGALLQGSSSPTGSTGVLVLVPSGAALGRVPLLLLLVPPPARYLSSRTGPPPLLQGSEHQQCADSATSTGHPCQLWMGPTQLAHSQAAVRSSVIPATGGASQSRPISAWPSAILVAAHPLLLSLSSLVRRQRSASCTRLQSHCEPSTARPPPPILAPPLLLSAPPGQPLSRCPLGWLAGSSVTVMTTSNLRCPPTRLQDGPDS